MLSLCFIRFIIATKILFLNHSLRDHLGDYRASMTYVLTNLSKLR